MAYMSWDTFQKKHKTSASFSASVSGKLPKGPHFDKNKRKLPTPYGLFRTWLSVSLVGDWTTTKVPGGFLVCVADLDEADFIKKRFGVTRTVLKTQISDQTYQLRYQDSNYGSLAKELDYDFCIENKA